MTLPQPTGGLRALLVGPVVEAGYVGGLQLALQNVADELRGRGWWVEAPLTLAEMAASSDLQSTRVQSGLSFFQRWPFLLELRRAIPEGLRQGLSAAFASRVFLEKASGNLTWLEERLVEPSRYDIVLICPDYNTPGVLALAAALHSRVVVISLAGLAAELGNNYWAGFRWLVRHRLSGRQHPFLFRAIQAAQIRTAVFASQHWLAAAVKAGLPMEVTQAIYFGIPLPDPVDRTPGRNRLLWVGRLTPEKGLHHILAALPLLRHRFPDMKFTAIAGQGEADYRQAILDLIERLNLSDMISWRPPVARAVLQEAYAEHDVLCFYSVVAEPVALVLMEAYAAGLPVVANQARYDSALVQDGQTCLCYEAGNAQSLATAISRLLLDGALGVAICHKARQLVYDHFSLQTMGNAYDRLLRKIVALPPTVPSAQV